MFDICIFLQGFNEVGGYEKLLDGFHVAVAQNRSLKNPEDPTAGYCNDVPDDFMHMIRSPHPGDSDLPWTGMLFGLAINSIWYWCSDQVRTLGTSSISTRY